MTRIDLRLHLPWSSLFVARLDVASVRVRAQTAAINDLKGKIFDAKMAQQTFAGGLKHCSELDGTNFYFQPRDRVLNLDDYHRSLESLALQGVFNPETKRPWNEQDADARWEAGAKASGRRIRPIARWSRACPSCRRSSTTCNGRRPRRQCTRNGKCVRPAFAARSAC